MPKVIPSINCDYKDLTCVMRRVRLAENVLRAEASGNRMVHLDIADGVFTFHKSWNDPNIWPELRTNLSVAVHLMAEDPAVHANAWLKAGARRVIVHLETVSPEMFGVISRLAKKEGAEIFLSLNPETKGSLASAYIADADGILVLAVHPGVSGQNFLPLSLDKISFLRELSSDVIITVDGGIDNKTAVLARQAGADEIVSASYLWESDKPGKAYNELLKIMSKPIKHKK